MSKESGVHHLIPTRDDNSDSADEDIEQYPKLYRRSDQSTFARIISSPYIIFVACFGLSVCSFWAGTYLQRERVVMGSRLAEKTSMWSPVLRDVDIKYEPLAFNGSFMDVDVYREEGSPEVDKAWEDLGVDYRAGVISYKDGIASGLDPSFVQRADKYGGGFMVNVEGMHHLHCLNLLRMSLYFNYNHYKAMGKHAFKNSEDILRLHITHCLDTVRQVLMCNFDTGVLGQVWVDPKKPHAFPDFRTTHVCKNYDEVREWARKLQAPPTEECPEDFLAAPRREDILKKTP